MGKNALCIILASPTSESAENKFVILVFLKYQGGLFKWIVHTKLCHRKPS